MALKNWTKHLTYIEKIEQTLTNEKDVIYQKISHLMHYLEKHHLLIKNYLDLMHRFVFYEASPQMIEKAPIEDLCLILTIIYRTDYMASDNDTYLMYYQSGMITLVLKNLIDKMKSLMT